MGGMERATTQRQAIWEVLERSPGPLLPEDVLAEARRTCPSLGQATVYRALKRLEGEGRLERVADPEGRARFESVRKHHHHFQCRACDRVYDVPGCAVRPPSSLRDRLPEGFRLEGHEVWLHGVCAACGNRA